MMEDIPDRLSDMDSVPETLSLKDCTREEQAVIYDRVMAEHVGRTCGLFDGLTASTRAATAAFAAFAEQAEIAELENMASL